MNPEIAFEFVVGILVTVMLGTILIKWSEADKEEEVDEHENNAI